MEFEYQWEDVAIDISETRPGQLFKRVSHPGLIYQCNTIDWARKRMFLEIYEFDLSSEDDLSVDFYREAKLGKKLTWHLSWQEYPTKLDVITEKLSYEVA